MATSKALLSMILLCSLQCTPTIEPEGDLPLPSSDAAVIESGLVLPETLSCESVIMCDSHRLVKEEVTMPSENGGVIKEGIYKAVGGVTLPYAVVFKNGRYSNLSWNLLVGHGTYSTEGDFLTTNLEIACSPNSEPGGNPLAVPVPTKYRYTARGDELFLLAECKGARCDPTIRLMHVDSLCSEDVLSSEECTLESCSCHELVGQSMPNDRADGDDKCALTDVELN